MPRSDKNNMERDCHECRFFEAGFSTINKDTTLEQAVFSLAQELGCSAECTLESGCLLYQHPNLRAGCFDNFKKGVKAEFLAFILGEECL